MKIDKDNYKIVFDKLTSLIANIPETENVEIKDAKKRIEEELNSQRTGCEELLRTNDILKIGVVGQVKAGKSSFLNSLIFEGENVLPRASTPMTAGLTILQYGEENTFDVEYYNSQEWQSFKDKDIEYGKHIADARAENPEATEEELAEGIDEALLVAHELVSKCGRKAESCVQKESKHDVHPFKSIEDLQNVLETYVGADGIYTPIVKSLTINIHDERLNGVQVIDTPGVNDPVVSREQRTRECLRGCHGVFLLSYSGRFFDQVDVSFLVNRIGEQGIGTIVVIASKFDSVLQDVGNKYHDDLLGAINECQRCLRAQMERNLSTSDFKGSDPELDFSSGIGFSIAHKEENRLDDTERNVVSQMRRFFPSFFNDSEDCRSHFNMLSSIDDIRENYLQKTFIDNKKKIIEKKLHDYFSGSTENIRKKVSSRRERLQQMLATLNENDIKDLKAQRKTYLDIVDNISRDIESVIKRAEQRADQAVKRALNGYSFSVSRIPTTPKTVSCNRKSTFFGFNKSFRVDYDVVDVNKLASTLEDGFTREITKINNLWERESSDIIQLIKDTIGNLIAERETVDKEGKLNVRLLRNILNETIDSMNNGTTLDFYGTKDRFESAVASCLQGQDDVQTSFGSMEEHEARNKVLNSAQKMKNKVQSNVSSLVQSMRTEVQKVIKTGREGCLEVLTDNKDAFIDTIKTNIQQYLDELESSLQNKEQNIAVLTEAINPLKELEGYLG